MWKELQPLAGRIRLPTVYPRSESAWHIFAVLVPAIHRDWFIRALGAEGIEAAFHFLPLHSSPYGMAALGYRPGDLPVTEAISASLVRLPLYPQLTAADLIDIVRAVTKITLAMPE
jgi:dTDP-4-amino-4,6-dideoxygalactose transaminase